MADGQTAVLLRSALANTTALGLDDHQIAALARMQSGEMAPGGLVAALAAVLTEKQFQGVVSLFAEASPDEAAPNAGAIERIVETTIEKRIKDRAFVETELAIAVADKLVGWSKLFAMFVALPVAGLLLILSLFGISKFEDLRSAVLRADVL